MRFVVIVALLAVTTACGSDDDTNDVPTVSFICRGGVGIYTTSEDVQASPGIAVLRNDPNCE